MSDLVIIPADCGYMPDPLEQIERDLSERPYAAGAVSGADFCFQHIGLIRNQAHGPSCCGQGGAAAVDGVRGPGAKPASAIGPWWDARRRMGNAAVVSGTYPFLVAESFCKRGIETRIEGEDVDEEKWVRQPDLDEEMDASDHHVAELDRYRIDESDSDLLDKLDAALKSGHGVYNGVNVGTRYHQFQGAAVRDIRESHALDLFAAGTTGGGHCRRIAAYRRRNGRRQYLDQNSWSKFWGLRGWWWFEGDMRRFDGVQVPPGAIDLSGCAWMDEDVVRASRDFQVLIKIA